MTRKHFVAIAHALADSRPDAANASAAAQWTLDMQRIASTLAETCSNFDRDRFVAAASA